MKNKKKKELLNDIDDVLLNIDKYLKYLTVETAKFESIKIVLTEIKKGLNNENRKK